MILKKIKIGLARMLRVAAAALMMNVKSSHASMSEVVHPWEWFKLQGHVKDSLASKFLCMVRDGNAQLGNRYKNRYGFKYVGCPSFLSLRLNLKHGEAPVLFGCPAVEKRGPECFCVYGLSHRVGFIILSRNSGCLSQGEWGNPCCSAGKWKENRCAAGVLADLWSWALMSLHSCKFYDLFPANADLLLTYIFFKSILNLCYWSRRQSLSGLLLGLWSHTDCFSFRVAVRRQSRVL